MNGVDTVPERYQLGQWNTENGTWGCCTPVLRLIFFADCFLDFDSNCTSLSFRTAFSAPLICYFHALCHLLFLRREPSWKLSRSRPVSSDVSNNDTISKLAAKEEGQSLICSLQNSEILTNFKDRFYYKIRNITGAAIKHWMIKLYTVLKHSSSKLFEDNSLEYLSLNLREDNSLECEFQLRFFLFIRWTNQRRRSPTFWISRVTLEGITSDIKINGLYNAWSFFSLVCINFALFKRSLVESIFF